MTYIRMRQPAIIDCHTHCFPPEVTANPRGWAEAHKEHHWPELVAPIKRPSIQGWATVAEKLAAMDAAGVEKAVMLGWYWENEATCRWHNEVIAEWQAAHPDRLIGFAAVYPNERSDNVIRQLEHAKALGLRGIGELHPGVQCFNASSPGWQAAADWCVAYDWPVNFHVTEAAGHPHPGSVRTPLNDFVRMAESHPKLKLILAHWGGGLAFFEHNPRLREALKNVYYDTAASPLLYEPSIFRNIINIVGPEKVLFGSDYPLRLYPRQQKQPDFLRYTESVRKDTEMTDAELEAVLRTNALRVLGIA